MFPPYNILLTSHKAPDILYHQFRTNLILITHQHSPTAALPNRACLSLPAEDKSQASVMSIICPRQSSYPLLGLPRTRSVAQDRSSHPTWRLTDYKWALDELRHCRQRGLPADVDLFPLYARKETTSSDERCRKIEIDNKMNNRNNTSVNKPLGRAGASLPIFATL